MCNIDNWWEAAVQLRELSLGFCDDLEGWDGVGVWEGAQDGGDVYTVMTDSSCCTAETNKTL